MFPVKQDRSSVSILSLDGWKGDVGPQSDTGEPMRLGNVLRTGIPLATAASARPVSGRSRHKGEDSADFPGIRPRPQVSISLSASKKWEKSANYLTVSSV